MLCAGVVSILSSFIHRLMSTYCTTLYTKEPFVSLVIIPFFIFLLLVMIYIPLSIIFSIKDKQFKSFIYNILLLIFYIIILVLSMLIDAPTLIYMT